MSKKIDNRIKRLSGQLASLQKNIADGVDCVDVIPQFLAIKGGVSGAFAAYIKESLTECEQADKKKVNKLIELLTRA